MNYYLEPLKEYLDNMSLKAQNLSIAKYENDIRFKIEQEKKKIIKQEAKFLKLTEAYPNLTTKKAAVVNPMILVLFTAMTIKAWSSYTKKFKEQYAFDDDLKKKMIEDDNAFQIQYLDIEDNENQDDDEEEIDEEENNEENEDYYEDYSGEEDNDNVLQEVDEEDEEDAITFRQKSKLNSRKQSQVNTPKAKAQSLTPKAIKENRKLGFFAKIKQKLSSIFLRKKIFTNPAIQEETFVRKFLTHEEDSLQQSNRQLINFKQRATFDQNNASLNNSFEINGETARINTPIDNDKDNNFNQK